MYEYITWNTYLRSAVSPYISVAIVEIKQKYFIIDDFWNIERSRNGSRSEWFLENVNVIFHFFNASSRPPTRRKSRFGAFRRDDLHFEKRKKFRVITFFFRMPTYAAIRLNRFFEFYRTCYATSGWLERAIYKNVSCRCEIPGRNRFFRVWRVSVGTHEMSLRQNFRGMIDRTVLRRDCRCPRDTRRRCKKRRVTG